MKLTGPQFNQIQEALLAAFDEASLRQMVRTGLDEDLPQVAGGENETRIVSSLVRWVERQSRVQELIVAAGDVIPIKTLLRISGDGCAGKYLSITTMRSFGSCFSRVRTSSPRSIITRKR